MEQTAQLTLDEAAREWGKLLFLGRDGQPAEQYTISKKTVVLGRLASGSFHLYLLPIDSCSGVLHPSPLLAVPQKGSRSVRFGCKCQLSQTCSLTL